MGIRKTNVRARSLRRAMPPAERKLWVRIRKKQLGGFRFRRQHTIVPYIADFACVEVKIVIELDGDQHGHDDGARDLKRDAFLEGEGWRVLRFWNLEIFENIDGVLETILDVCTTEKRTREYEKSDNSGYEN